MKIDLYRWLIAQLCTWAVANMSNTMKIICRRLIVRRDTWLELKSRYFTKFSSKSTCRPASTSCLCMLMTTSPSRKQLSAAKRHFLGFTLSAEATGVVDDSYRKQLLPLLGQDNLRNVTITSTDKFQFFTVLTWWQDKGLYFALKHKWLLWGFKTL